MPPRTRETAADRTQRLINEAVDAALTRNDKRHEDAMKRYKDRVEIVARDVAERQGWCDSGLREALGELDIDIPSTYRVRVTVELTIGEQESEDAAKNAVLGYIETALGNAPAEDDIGNVDVDFDHIELED